MGRQGGRGEVRQGRKGGSLMNGRGAVSRRAARGVHGANLLDGPGAVGWVGRHEGGANGVALAVASSTGASRVRSNVFLGGSTTHDDADDATKKSVALPERRGGV